MPHMKGLEVSDEHEPGARGVNRHDLNLSDARLRRDMADLLLAVEQHRAVAEPVAELAQRHADQRPAGKGRNDPAAAMLDHLPHELDRLVLVVEDADGN